MLINAVQPVLVVGGAGFIGSHMVLALQKAGFLPVVFDNLSNGHRDAVTTVPLIVGQLSDSKLLNEVFSTYAFKSVLHFASYIEVAESVQNPAKYYQNNVAATLTLLEVMLAHQVKNFIFSSSAAVYGEPLYTPIDESHPLLPINPYGTSKWMVEKILQDYAKGHALSFAILRYFNAAGADPSGKLAERHEPESHLIPLMLQVANGKKESISIYGDDYPTPDGTAIRDYIHVQDLCAAHMLALYRLLEGKTEIICNLGAGLGYSVKQVLDSVRKITKHPIPANIVARRSGDPAILLADIAYAEQELGWKPQYSHLETIIEHAWYASMRPAVVT